MDSGGAPPTLFDIFDPFRPLAADESELYVDWQAQQFREDDVKSRLVNAVMLGAAPTTRLFTGHRGSGKTTELERVAERLRNGVDTPNGRRRALVVFVRSTEVLELTDLGPEDLIWQIARSLARELDQLGYDNAGAEYHSWFQRVVKGLTGGIGDMPVQVGDNGLNVTFRLRDFTADRDAFRDRLRREIPTLQRTVNERLLNTETRRWLKEHHDLDDIVMIVDELDRIPETFDESGTSNYESIYFRGGWLNGLACDVILTLPVEFVYSPSAGRLGDVFGQAPLVLPSIAVINPKTSGPDPAGLATLWNVVRRRSERADVDPDRLFDSEDTRRRVLTASGGHPRQLFSFLRAFMERQPQPPWSGTDVDRWLLMEANKFAALPAIEHWPLIDEVARSHQQVNGEELWNELLRQRFVLAYHDGTEEWYDANPLLKLATRRRQPLGGEIPKP